MNKKDIVDALIPYFQKNERYFFLAADMGFGATDKLKNTFPDRIINIGIREQAMVGIAAGMALSGMIPIVYSFCNFLAFRALEQIRNDVVLQNLNVKFIGVGADNYFDFLGESHTCNYDDVTILNIIGLKKYDNFNEWIESDKAGYIRV